MVTKRCESSLLPFKLLIEVVKTRTGTYAYKQLFLICKKL